MKSICDIVANPNIGERGLVDLYLPEKTGPFPTVIGIHGGGWQGGDRTSYAQFCPRIIPHGYAFLLCSYRLAPEFPFPAAYEDLIIILRWVKANAEKYNLDSERMALLGGSAGGHLVSLLATKGLKEEPDIVQFKAVVDYCGITDLKMQYEFDCECGSTMTEKFMACTPGENPELYQQASPVCNIHPRTPPIWISHGTDDNVVPVDSSKNFHQALNQTGIKSELMLAEGRKHTLCADDSDSAKGLLFEDSMLRFLKKNI